MQVQYIESLELPGLGPYRTLRQHEEHRSEGIFVAEGDKVVRRLLESDFGVVSVLLPAKRLAEFEPLVRARSEDVPVYVIEIRELEKLTGFPFFQGVLAVGRVPKTHTLEGLLAAIPAPRLLVAIDGLTNAENVGVVVRNAAAFGAHGLIVDGTSASPFLRRAVRNSMGTIFKMPVVEVPAVSGALTTLRNHGVQSIAAHPREDSLALHDSDLRRDCCIVFGSEGTGLKPEVLAECEVTVGIPMSNQVDSLNVSTAAAVFLYEAARQRSRGKCLS